MANRKYVVNLSEKGINYLISLLENEQNSYREKLRIFVRRLIDIGIPIIDARINKSQGDSDKSHTIATNLDDNGDTISASITLSGRDVLFIEFGAGIYYNKGNNNPKAAEMGYGVGTYPHQTHAINPGYWWYKGDDGKLHFSLGTEATMPMYKASIEMIKRVEEVAMEVFS